MVQFALKAHLFVVTRVAEMNNRIAIAAVLPVVLACVVACDGGSKTNSAAATAPAPAPTPTVAAAPAQSTPVKHAPAHHPAVVSTSDTSAAPSTRVAAAAVCQDCATVQEVHSVKRKGDGGAVGMIGGAVVGGLLGHQVGGGTGKTLATVGGAAAGAFAGNEVQKQVNSKTVWVTTVKMRDGTTQSFEQDAQPGWTAGQQVHVKDGALRTL
jgi:outer membrane lipoprotein SlyB